MRALADPDAWPETDLVLRRRLAARGGDPDVVASLAGLRRAAPVERRGRGRPDPVRTVDDGGDRMTGTTAPLQATEVQTPVGTLAIVVDDGAVVASGFTSLEDQLGRLPGDLSGRGRRPHRRPGRGHRRGRAPTSPATSTRSTTSRCASPAARSPRRRGGRCGRSRPARPGRTPSSRRRPGTRPPSGRPAPRARTTGWRRSSRATGWCARAATLGGYYYGLPVKRWLLDHERGVTTAF